MARPSRSSRERILARPVAGNLRRKEIAANVIISKPTGLRRPSQL